MDSKLTLRIFALVSCGFVQENIFCFGCLESLYMNIIEMREREERDD